MVRLRLVLPHLPFGVSFFFQFRYGAIETPVLTKSVSCLLNFQFRYGAIETQVQHNGPEGRGDFQFRYGAIETWLHP